MGKAEGTPAVLSWRTPRWLRAVFYVLAVLVAAVPFAVWSGLVIDTSAITSSTGAEIATSAFFPAFGFWLWWQAYRARITLDDDAVTVVNTFCTRRVPLDDIERTDVGYYGIYLIGRRDPASGRSPVVMATAVQQNNLSKWRGRRTRADDVVATIEDAVARHRAAGGTGATTIPGLPA